MFNLLFKVSTIIFILACVSFILISLLGLLSPSLELVFEWVGLISAVGMFSVCIKDIMEV